MVPVMKGRAFFSVISFKAGPYSPLRHSSIYSGISCSMGHPPLQGARKQSSQGTCSRLLRVGSGLMGFKWWISCRADAARSAMAAESVPANAR